MADNILKARVRHAYKTDAEWANANPILLKGEIAYSSDIRQTKTGDGTAHWADLEYDVAKPAWHEHDLSEMINKLNANGSIPKDNDYYISQYVGGGTTTTTYQRRPMSALWEYIKAKANSLYTRIEDFNLLKNTVTDNTKVVNRVKNGINSIINSDDSISVNPSINGMGYAIHRGGSGCVKFDGFELPIYQDSIEYLFDGKSSTYLRFESIQDYCDIKQIAWNSTKQYKKGDFVVLLNNGNINSYLLFKALSDNTGKNPLENPSIWYDNYRDSTNTYAGTAILRKILIQVEVVLPKIADWETGYSIYFRSAGQTVRDLLVEAGDINKENWQTEGRISGVCGPVVTIFPNKNMSGKKRSIRLSFYNRNDNTEWTAITQIAITGLVGGLEGTVLNKGGGELYGNVYPHQSNVINLGDSSHKWNAVYANNFKGNADTATKATSATKADSATTATTANKATLASAVENSGTASDGAARHVWFSNSTDETKRASSDNLKYTPNTQMLTTNVSGNAGSATKLQTIRKVDGVNFDGSADITHYGTCSTAAGTAAKTVTLNGFNLATGAKVAVKFTVTNTAANPTLNVNGTGAKSIKYRGAAISTDALAANRIYEFIYDGTDYVFVGDINTDTNTTYGNMIGATTSAAGKAGLVPAPAAGASTRYLRSDGTWQVPPDTTYNDATTSTHGLMSTSDKSKLDGIASGANKTTVDSALNDSSTNPVQNKVIVSALLGRAINLTLTNENLNAITTPGFYNASGGNTCTNKPTNVDEFGLEVIHTASGNYYVQILYRKDLSYRRTCVNGIWSAWTTDKLTDTTYNDATTSEHGLMSVTDKKKLDGIAEGANKITVDSAMSSSSTNPVQNKIVQAALDTKAAKDKGALFVVGTHTATTNAWTGKLSGVSALYDGLLIDYWVPFTGTSAGDTLNLTLDDGTTTGAKNMYYRGTSRLTTHYSTGYVIRLVYRTAAVINGTTYSGWWNVSSFDSTNTTDISFGNGRIYAGTNGIWRYTLVALDSTGKWQSFVTSSSTGTSKTINTSAKFRLPATIYYYGANNDATNGNLVPSTYNVWQIKCVADLRYSTNCTTTQFTANAPIYLECTLSSDRYFQVTSTCITQTFTKGKYYIYLGNTYSTAYQLCLTSQHPVYYYDGTNLVDYVYSLLDNKSDVGHTHNYAGSSSAGGVANSATKLATTRNISANDDYIMNFNFDGSGNVSTQLRAYNAIIAVANVNNYPYHRFAKLDTLTDSYQDRVTNLLITQDFNGGGWGICRIVLRTNNQSNTLSSASVDWLVRCGLAADSVQIGLYTKDGSTYADAFFKTVGTYWSTTIRNLGSGSRGNIGRTWTFINSSETNNTTTTDKKTSYEVYVSLADAGTALHNQAYTSTITGVDVGTVKYANTSGSATSATKDSANQQINTTYIKGLSANGKTITYTKGDNKTGTATISGFVPMEGTTKDNPMTGAIIQSSTDNGHTYLAGYTPSGSRLISSSSSGTRTTELTPSSFTTNLETGDAETSGALDVTFYPQKNKQMIYLGGSSSDWIIRGVGTPTESGDAVNKNYIDSTLENLSNDFVEELQGLIPVYGTWEDTPVTGNIVFNGKATVTGVKEPSSDSDVATKGYVDRQNSIKSVTLTAAGWTGTAAPYTQTVKVDGITEDDNPVMVSMLAAGATPDTQKAYNKAFGIICSGTGTTANGSVTFSVYSKPATDITVGLKGV